MLKHLSKSTKNTVGSMTKKTIPRKLRLPIFIGAFGVIGLAIILAVNAAAPFGSVEPEDGNVANGASVIFSGSASGGQAVKFGTLTPPATQTPPTTRKPF